MKKYIFIALIWILVLSTNEILAETGTAGTSSGEQLISNIFSETETVETSSVEPLITNIFSETDLRQVLRDISIQTGINIVADNTVQGMVSMEIRNLPMEKALEMLLAPGGYVFNKRGDYYLVGLPKPSNPSFLNLCSVEYIKLKYLNAGDATLILPGVFSKYIQSNSNNDLLTVTAPDNIISEIKKCIKSLDLPPKQIMIEAIVTEVSSQAIKNMGMDWKWEGGSAKGAAGEHSGDISFNNLTGKINYFSTSGVTKNILATLKLLIEKGDAKIRANPRVIAIDKQEAKIYIGKEKYYSISGPEQYSYARLEMISSGITLKIKPRINGNDEVTVKIDPEVSDVSGGEAALERLPLINKRNVSTTVRVKDGETIVIGGLLQQQERKGENSIPILGKLPIIGFLFKNKSSVVSENEIVILITPHIIKEGL